MGLISIVLISSGQPSANPRLVKEAAALSGAGYKITVIYVPISPWADAFDVALFNKYPQIKFVQAGYHPVRQSLKYLWARTRRKFISRLSEYLGDAFNIADYSTVLFGQELLSVAKKYRADLYIAHNIGALPVAVKVARHYEAKAGFDAEDFHRGEVSQNNSHFKLTKVIEDKYFPSLNYFTAASPLIHQKYSELYPSIISGVVNNVFEKSMAVATVCRRTTGKPLKLFWFSQTVGKGRGIEDVIKAVCINPKEESIYVTLLGSCSQETLQYFESLVPYEQFKHKIIFSDPVSPDALFDIANQHHIGLALEPGRDMNNNIALSNKIFTYMLGGNALILSDTDGQALFYKENKALGSLYRRGNVDELATIISNYIHEPELLYQQQCEALQLAKNVFNWETESKKFLSLVDSILS